MLGPRALAALVRAAYDTPIAHRAGARGCGGMAPAACSTAGVVLSRARHILFAGSVGQTRGGFDRHRDGLGQIWAGLSGGLGAQHSATLVWARPSLRRVRTWLGFALYRRRARIRGLGVARSCPSRPGMASGVVPVSTQLRVSQLLANSLAGGRAVRGPAAAASPRPPSRRARPAARWSPGALAPAGAPASTSLPCKTQAASTDFVRLRSAGSGCSVDEIHRLARIWSGLDRIRDSAELSAVSIDLVPLTDFCPDSAKPGTTSPELGAGSGRIRPRVGQTWAISHRTRRSESEGSDLGPVVSDLRINMCVLVS